MPDTSQLSETNGVEIDAGTIPPEVSEQGPGRLKRIQEGLSVLFASRIAMVGLGIVLFWIFVAVFAPLLTPYTPLEQDWKSPNQGPSAAHILGTDELGRDLWSRLIYGARVVLVILPISEKYWIPGGTAIWGVFVALLVGTTLGLVSGYYGGWLDEIVMRLLDAMMAIPIILLFLIIMAALGASAVNVVIAITIVGTPGIARLVRSLTLDIRTREYIRAAETRGESPWFIMFVEILPNARGPIIVDAMLRVGYAIFAMGTLGFLGLGMPPPSPDWGAWWPKAANSFLKAPFGRHYGRLWPSLPWSWG